MTMDFNADEIFEMAEQIERNGISFYRKAANGTDSPSTRELLKRLAAWEGEHLKFFSRLRAALTEQERRKKFPDPENQESDYLRAWADHHVFDLRTDPAEKITGKERIEDILEMAIRLEKDSIVFYLGMKDVVPQRLGRDKVQEIIREEMRHVDVLSREIETLRHQPL